MLVNSIARIELIYIELGKLYVGNLFKFYLIIFIADIICLFDYSIKIVYKFMIYIVYCKKKLQKNRRTYIAN